MDVEGGFLELAVAGEDSALGVEREEVRSRDLAPVQPVAIEQEALALRQHEAEVVADAFVQIEAHRQAKRCREIDTRGADFQLVHGTHAPDYSVAMKTRAAVVLVALLLLACSKITQENFLKIQEGMSEQEVLSLLGPPTESQSVNILGVSGTASRWIGKDAVIAVRFVNGKVALKSFDKPPGKAQ